ncbi:MAG: alpha/beta hydrolase, partial [Promethearchaeota archaeon]
MDRSEPDRELIKEEQDSIETTEKKILLLKQKTNLDLHDFLMTIRNKPMTAAFLRKKGNSDERISEYFKDLNGLRADILNIYLDNYERRFKLKGENKTTLDFSRIMVPNEKYMRSEDGVPIYYQKWSKRSETTKGLFLCQHGNSVHGDLFAPFSDIARMNGWDVIAVDNTGHGRSGIKNGLIDNYKRMYFIYNKLISTWLKEHPGKPIFLIGESLGSSFIIGYIADLFRKTACLKRRMKPMGENEVNR